MSTASVGVIASKRLQSLPPGVPGGYVDYTNELLWIASASGAVVASEGGDGWLAGGWLFNATTLSGAFSGSAALKTGVDINTVKPQKIFAIVSMTLADAYFFNTLTLSVSMPGYSAVEFNPVSIVNVSQNSTFIQVSREFDMPIYNGNPFVGLTVSVSSGSAGPNLPSSARIVFIGLLF